MELWKFLKTQNACGLPWFVRGNFNITRYDSEKVGGILRAPPAKRDFNEFIHVRALVDLPYEENRLSWCNERLGGRRIWAQLDRILVNVQFTKCFGDSTVLYLLRTSLDHAPMLVQISKDRAIAVHPFKFLRMWGSHEEFLPLV